MARASLLLALCFAAAHAGIKMGRPKNEGVKIATREEELAEKARKNAEKDAYRALSPEEKKSLFKSKLGEFGSGEARAKKYAKTAFGRRFGMSDKEYAKQKNTYAQQAMAEAASEAKNRKRQAQKAAEDEAIRESRAKLLGRKPRKAAAKEPLDLEAEAPPAVAGSRRGLSPDAKRLLGKSALFATAVAAAKFVSKLAMAPAQPHEAPVEEVAAEEPAGDATEPAGDAPEPAAEDAAAEVSEEAAEEAAPEAPAHTGITPEAQARLDEYKAREAVLGRIEGQYKLRGEEIPLEIRSKPLPELEEHLAELRGPSAAAASGDGN